MAKYYINSISNSFGVYANFTPKNLPNEWVEITEEQYNEVQAKLEDGYTFKYVNGAFEYEKIEHIETTEEREARLRAMREPLLKAFDIYKSNVAYGIENDTNRDDILDWYSKALALDENALTNPPRQIKYYL